MSGSFPRARHRLRPKTRALMTRLPVTRRRPRSRFPPSQAWQSKNSGASKTPTRDGAGEHARPAEILRYPIGQERRQDRQGDLDAWITNPAPQPQHQPADADSPEYFADNNRGE